MKLRFTRETPAKGLGIWVARTGDPYRPYTVVQTAAGYFTTVGVDGAGNGAQLLDASGHVAREYKTFTTLEKAKRVAQSHFERFRREVEREVKLPKTPNPQEVLNWLESLPEGYTFKRKANMPTRHGPDARAEVTIVRGSLGGVKKNVIRPGHWPGWYADTFMGFDRWSRGRAPGVPRSMLVDGGTNTIWDNIEEVVLSEYRDVTGMGNGGKVKWHVQRDDRTTGFKWWVAYIDGKEVGVSGMPAKEYPDGTVTEAEWTVFVEGEPSQGPFKSPDEAKAAAEGKRPKKSKAGKKKPAKKKTKKKPAKKKKVVSKAEQNRILNRLIKGG